MATCVAGWAYVYALKLIECKFHTLNFASKLPQSSLKVTPQKRRCYTAQISDIGIINSESR
jgi:hypothetical protein